MAQELFCRHLSRHAPKQYYAARRTVANYYLQLLEALKAQGDKESYCSSAWLELVLALAFQLLLLPDEASHMKATEHLLDAFQRRSQEHYGEILAVLRQVSQEQVANQANLHAKRIAKHLLRFVEAASGYQMQKRLLTANDLLEVILHEPASSSKLRAHLYYNRGWAFYQLTDYQQALQDFDRTLELAPDYVKAYHSCGWIYMRLKEYQQALDAFNHALTLNPNYVLTYDWRGWAFYYLGEYQQALQDFDRAIELDPYFFDAYRGRSNACMGLKDYRLALAPLDRAIEQTPESSRLYGYRGWTNWDFRAYQQALKDFDRAIELEPKWAINYYGRGLILYRLKEYQSALDAYDRVLEYEPDNARAYTGRGEVLFQLKQYQQALEALGRAIELDLHSDGAYEVRGRIYRELKDYRRSLEEYNRYVKVTLFSPGHAYFQRGYAYLYLNDTGRAAEADFIRSSQLDSWYYMDGRWMSEWCSMCQPKATSVTSERLETIALTNAQHYSAYICRGIVLWFCESFEKALEELEQAILLQAERHDAYFWKGIVCAMLGQGEEAIGAIENALKLALPPVLLAPLHWLEQERADFFEHYVVPLLARY